jgi:hypothetical protein
LIGGNGKCGFSRNCKVSRNQRFFDFKKSRSSSQKGPQKTGSQSNEAIKKEIPFQIAISQNILVKQSLTNKCQNRKKCEEKEIIFPINSNLIQAKLN